MRKGALLTNTWLIGAFSLLILLTLAVIALQQGSMALEFGGLEMTFAPHEEGGVRLSVGRAFGESQFSAP